MIPVDEALLLVLTHTTPLKPKKVRHTHMQHTPRCLVYDGGFLWVMHSSDVPQWLL